MANKLGKEGYFTNVMHANNKSFWNRDIMYKSLNIDKFYDIESYEIGEGESVNWGMKDIPFFEQSVELMKDMPATILLTTHYANKSLSI